MKNKHLIAITGGIGSGKSLALSTLQENGYAVLSSDKIVTSLYEKRKIKLLLKSLFPTAVTGKIKLNVDRKIISACVFNDHEMLKKLTDLITPLVMEEILKRYKKAKTSVFAEVPLLFECGFEKHFDQVIVVMRDTNARIESVKSRSNLSEEQIVARMNAQFNYDNNDLSKHIVVNNNGAKERLKQKILDIAKEF